VGHAAGGGRKVRKKAVGDEAVVPTRTTGGKKQIGLILSTASNLL
jgi:hypothetical protein